MFSVIGMIITVLLLSLFMLVAISLVVVLSNVRRSKLLLKVSISVLDFFHLQLKMLMRRFFPRMNFEQVMIDARNDLNKEKFAETDKRVFLAPHCMRASDCPAISTQYGIQCVLCGECQLEMIKREAERLNYSIFILAGSSFVKKLIEETDPDGILLLGCAYEINKVMMALNGRVTYGVTLLRDGCVNTAADFNKIITTLHLGRETKGEGDRESWTTGLRE